MPASRDLIRRIVLDYGFWDGYLDRPWETFDDDPPGFAAELALLSAGEMSLEVRVLQNPNLMTLTTDEEASAARPMLAAALNLLSDGPPLPEPRFAPTLQERLAYQLDHWNCREKGRSYRWTLTAAGWALTQAGGG